MKASHWLILIFILLNFAGLISQIFSNDYAFTNLGHSDEGKHLGVS